MEVPNQGFSKILNLIFKKNFQEVENIINAQPAVVLWKSNAYNLEIAQAFRHKLLRYSNFLGLELVLKMEVCSE